MILDRPEIIALAGAGFAALVTLDYVISIFRNKTKPHAFTWAIWSLILCIVALAQWKQGAGPGAWPAAASAFNCGIVFILSLFKGERNITKGDWIALLCALSIIPIWHTTDDGLLAVILATCIDACAYYPTIRKSWMKPHEETILMYASDNLRWIPAILASSDFSATTLIYPIFCLIVNNVFALMLFLRRRALRT